MEDAHRRDAAGIAREVRRRFVEGRWAESDREKQQVASLGAQLAGLDLAPTGRQAAMDISGQLAERPPVLVHREQPLRGAVLALQQGGPELRPELQGASKLVSSRLAAQFPAWPRRVWLPQQPVQRRVGRQLEDEQPME